MNVNKTSALVASLAVITAIVAGLLTAGSPEAERDRRVDELRVADLQRLAGVISQYYAATNKLPLSLATLVDGQRLQSEPLDPASSEPYVYTILADEAYELCANFDNRTEPATGNEFWSHGTGRTCFRLSPAYGEF